MREQREEAEKRHPEQDGSRGVNRLHFHFLAAQPQFRSSGWSNFGWFTAVIHSGFSAQGEEKHECAQCNQ